MRPQTRIRKLANNERVAVQIHGRRAQECAPNSLKFLATVEGVRIDSAHIRGANGIRWRLP